MNPQQKHVSHPAILHRLKRAQGHLQSVIAMIEEGRSCLDVAQQLHAVEAAVGNAKREVIHDHIEHCLEATGSDAAAATAVAELKALAKYL